MPRKLDGSYIQTGSITTTQLSSQVTQVIEAGGGPRVTSLVYPGDDTAANTVGGQTVYIVGSGFETNNAIYINGSAVPAKSFISASNLSFTTPALSEGIYPIYVINTDTGATAIYVPGLTVSNEPTWISSAAIEATETWEISLSATGDGQITYALANGSSLPGGISLAANGLISGTLTSPPETDTQYTFTVVASDAQNQDSSRQFTVTVSTGEGVLFANNVLLIHADGTNNQNNHTFLDSSSNGLTITRAGNATQGSFSPFAQTGWSAYFDGTTDSISFSSIELTSDFTIEAWIYPERIGNGSGSQAIIFAQSSPNNQFTYNANGTIGYYNGSVDTVTSTTISLEKWNHVAWVRSGSSTRIYINGANSAINSSDSGSRYVLKIGEFPSPTGYAFKGFISNARVTANAMYSGSSFSLPTSPLEVTANTKLLTLKSNRFIDSNTTPLTITRDNDTKITPFSPFAPTAAYSTANVGGSVYLDGSGDYLTPADSTATDLGISRQPFTLEWWTYFTTTSGGQYIISKGGGFGGWNSTTGWQYVFSIEFSSSVFSLGYYNGSSYTYWQPSFSSVGVFGRWNHMVLSYDGTNLSAYVNGTRIGTTTVTNFTKPSSSNKCGIGSTLAVTSEAYHYSGYISDFRIVQGNAVYDPTASTLTVPTAPLTNIANTSLLLNFTNAGIFDQTAKNVLETVGDAKVSTAQYKYGTASMYFDGTGDYLFISNNAVNTIGSGDFTIEFWVRPGSLSDWNGIIGIGPTNPSHLCIRTTSSGTIEHWLNAPANKVTSNTSLTVNTWSHVALVRYGSASNNVKLYINGNLTSQVTSTYSVPQYPIVIGRSYDAYDGEYYNGYIDDLRITKGYARYTSNFTPPTSALKDK